MRLSTYVTDVLGIDNDGKDVESRMGEEEMGSIDDSFFDLQELLDETRAIMQGLGIEDEQVQPYDAAWLQQQLKHLPTELVKHVLGILAKKDAENDLLDVLGYENIELVAKILEHRSEILHDHGSDGDEGPAFGQKIVVQTASEKRASTSKRGRKRATNSLETLVGRKTGQEPQYPHVYGKPQIATLAGQQQFALAEGVEHVNEATYEEFTLPPSEHGQADARVQSARLVSISSLADPLLAKAFPSYSTLNRMQSIVFPAAYHSNENLLVSAPTGAGKTDIALLAILRCLRDSTGGATADAGKSEFRAVYVAPMKALAAEIVGKFAHRLRPFGVHVRECTGDTQLTRTQLAEANVLVTTPEKWDVLTRKSDEELVGQVQLLIIDEVHLLHDGRGAVLEAIVARTLRQVEQSQRMIRIVGLSATLPNYTDIAAFLRVNPWSGMFYFDGSFRPVPLTQTVIGVKGRSPRTVADTTMSVCYRKAVHFARHGHQTMVFVHGRNDTVRTARTLIRLAGDDGTLALFSAKDTPGFSEAVQSANRTRNRDLRDLFELGFGVHHAGMARSDRLLTERLFSSGHIRLLCCTATLAWGVNLPAHAVIIKGTLVYDSQQGSFVHLGILDVLQIFGRAGRPQFESQGEGILITTHEQMTRYLSALSCQAPIESRFLGHLVDNLMAEVVLGTVSCLDDALAWLDYTYLAIRMRRSPTGYGVSPKEAAKDSRLHGRLRSVLREAAVRLRNAGMLAIADPHDGQSPMKARLVGRTASLYYVRVDSIERFSEHLQLRISDEQLLGLVGMASEFDGIRVRDEEAEELLFLLHEAPMRVTPSDDATSTASKVNVLLQASISRLSVEAFSLQSDMQYVEQNAGRLLRALFEIARGQAWARASLRALRLCIAVERRRWSEGHPLAQFDLANDVLGVLASKQLTLERLTAMDAAELSKHLDHRAQAAVSRALARFPRFSISTCRVAPITPAVLRVVVGVTPSFLWDSAVHGTSESAWLYVESLEDTGCLLLAHEHVRVTPKTLDIERLFTLHVPMTAAGLNIRLSSDRWLHCEQTLGVDTGTIASPNDRFLAEPTDLLPLAPLPITALHDARLEGLYLDKGIAFFNSVQTQAFHALYHCSHSVLIGAPTGSGKTVLAELAIWHALRSKPDRPVVYIAPMKALLRERMLDWQERLQSALGITVVPLSGDDPTPPQQVFRQTGLLLVSTPEKWDALSRHTGMLAIVRRVSLLVVDEMHLLGSEQRGHVVEALVVRLQRLNPAVRIVGLSTALSTAGDMAAWMAQGSAKPSQHEAALATFNFRPSVRPVPVEVRIEGFAETHYCPRMASMNRPAYQAIIRDSADRPVLVFVSSRRQTRLTAFDLIRYASLEGNPRRWITSRDLDEATWSEQVAEQAQDPALRHCLSFGIALHHAGLSDSDRALSERLFSSRMLSIMVATATLAWGVNLPAHMVIIKGTEHWDAQHGGYVDMPITDILQMIGRAGRPQFDTSARAVLMVHEARRAFYRRFLYEPFPVESSMASGGVLADHVLAEIAIGDVSSVDTAMRWARQTYLHYRLQSNPSYYRSGRLSNDDFLEGLLRTGLDELAESRCIAREGEASLAATALGRIAAFYCISHLTVRSLSTALLPDRPLAAPDFGVSPDLLSSIYLQTSLACEFADMPVRHNEDKELLAWLRSLRPAPFALLRDPAFALPSTSPHLKTYILLRSHAKRLSLPIPDLHTDAKLALEHACRILSALTEVAANRGDGAAAIAAVHAMQELASRQELFGKREGGFYKEQWDAGKLLAISHDATHVYLQAASHKSGSGVEHWHLFFMHDRLLAYRRVRSRAGRMVVDLPSALHSCTLLVMSDSQIGLDQMHRME